MAKVDQPIFILPKKRSGKKINSVIGNADHIISVQGGESQSNKYKNGLSPTREHVNGIIHSSMDGLTYNIKMTLPTITDDEESLPDVQCKESDHKDDALQNDKFQPISSPQASREVVNLSPIYENSSDACSSHDDLRDIKDHESQKNCRMFYSDLNERSSSATPNSCLSQTLSENSLEMGPFTDSLKNSSKRKKKVNITLDMGEMEHTEITALRVDSKESISIDKSVNSRDEYLTITGTIKRGKKKGQNVDVKLNISREELEMIERSIAVEDRNESVASKCSLYYGVHILILGLICLPFVGCVSSIVSFFMGTKTWYNILNHVTEDPNYMKKAVLAPMLILLFPLVIVCCAVGVGAYAAVAQLRLSARRWWREVADLEKGFYSWLCDALRLSHCSPYEVVLLTHVQP